MKDPEQYLSQTANFMCPVQKEKPAILDPDHWILVNHEIFFFSGPDQQREFAANPLAYCGLLTDPVSRERFQPGEASPRTEFQDRLYFFVSEETLGMFQATPDSFTTPNLSMVPKYKTG